MFRQIAFILKALLVLTLAVKKSYVTPEAKLRQLVELAESSSNNVVSMDESTYTYYAMSKPSPYSLMVLFTASHPKFKCDVCNSIDSEFQTLASSYLIEKKKNPDNFDNFGDIFFVRIDYAIGQKLFNKYSIANVPLLIHLPPLHGVIIQSDAEDVVKNEENVSRPWEIDSRSKWQVPAVPDAESMVSFLRTHTGVSYPISRSSLSSYLAIFLLIAILVLSIKPIVVSLPFILAALRLKALWMFISFGIYTFAISGIVFDMIRNPPFMSSTRTGVTFFYPQSGSQFVIEGFIIGFLNVISAISCLCLLKIVPNIKSIQTKGIVMIVSILGFLGGFLQVRGFYTMKNRWYMR